MSRRRNARLIRITGATTLGALISVMLSSSLGPAEPPGARAGEASSRVVLRPYAVWSAPLDVSGVVPGASPIVQVIEAVSPPANGPLQVMAVLEQLSDDEFGCVGPELDLDPGCTPQGELSDQLKVEIWRSEPVQGSCPATIPAGNGLPLLPGTELATVRDLGLDATPNQQWLDGGDVLCLTVAAWLPDRTDNNVTQSDGCSFRMKLVAVAADGPRRSDDNNSRTDVQDAA